MFLYFLFIPCARLANFLSLVEIQAFFPMSRHLWPEIKTTKDHKYTRRLSLRPLENGITLPLHPEFSETIGTFPFIYQHYIFLIDLVDLQHPIWFFCQKNILW